MCGKPPKLGETLPPLCGPQNVGKKGGKREGKGKEKIGLEIELEFGKGEVFGGIVENVWNAWERCELWKNAPCLGNCGGKNLEPCLKSACCENLNVCAKVVPL